MKEEYNFKVVRMLSDDKESLKVVIKYDNKLRDLLSSVCTKSKMVPYNSYGAEGKRYAVKTAVAKEINLGACGLIFDTTLIDNGENEFIINSIADSSDLATSIGDVMRKVIEVAVAYTQLNEPIDINYKFAVDVKSCTRNSGSNSRNN